MRQAIQTAVFDIRWNEEILQVSTIPVNVELKSNNVAGPDSIRNLPTS